MDALIVVCPDGTVDFLYDDALRPLLEEGDFTIRRASHVEPTADGQWQVDLSPVGGPSLPPTAHRSDALAAEAAWLNRNRLLHRAHDAKQLKLPGT